MERKSGVLMPIASLPSRFGIGCFDQAAYDFVDRLAEAGQSYWQILPMGPTGYGDSPYQSFSTFAGNPYFISLSAFVSAGFLTERECMESAEGMSDHFVRYDIIYQRRFRLLRKAFDNSRIETDPAYNEFAKENADWLNDYALFMAIKDSKKGISYLEWEDAIRLRDPEAMVSYRNKLMNDVAFYQFLQFEFSTQWNALKKYANEHGVEIIGDIPIYVAMDSADTWAHPELFQLDKKGRPTHVAGCPPDAFSEDGQLWGNPLYAWDKHRETGYEWWISRIRHVYNWYDIVRVDHFRGFDEYYAVPYGEKTARNGEWKPGPGLDLFRAARRELGEFRVIAEDLGFLTDSVREMLDSSGFPGMKVLQFAFDPREDNDYLPHNYGRNSVVYTGTHDNETTLTWWRHLPAENKNMAMRYLGASRFSSAKKLTWRLIELAEASVSDTCIIPMQDLLCLGDSARINTPSTIGHNWLWRMKPNAFSPKLVTRLHSMTRLYGRSPES
ncbi:MAG: 4-alpha-glucanotransferase [Eubacterium sp.]|nr:4-alpha-glucanotransferase [Eubacterium sp.]